jgi:hypothetical protein
MASNNLEIYPHKKTGCLFWETAGVGIKLALYFQT